MSNLRAPSLIPYGARILNRNKGRRVRVRVRGLMSTKMMSECYVKNSFNAILKNTMY